MNKIIFLDIDDTLADTTEYVRSKYFFDGFSIHKNINYFLYFFEYLKIWNSIKKNPSFWEILPLTKNAKNIYIESLAITENIHVLTALPSLFYKKNTIEFDRAKNAKIKWIRTHFPNIPKENIHVCYAKEKHFFIKKELELNLLIDDSKSNIKRWRNAGGTAILVESNNNNYLNEIISLQK